MAAVQTMEAPLNIEAAVADFLSDPSRTSLELPPMPALQRKQVKALADQDPTVTCKSFGLGADRCLQLFKSQGGGVVGKAVLPAGENAPSFSVKNTFIDDWVGAEGEDVAEPVIFRSMPPQLPRASMATETSESPTKKSGVTTIPCMRSVGGKLDLSPISESTPKWPAELGASKAGKAPVFMTMPVPEETSAEAAQQKRPLPMLLGGAGTKEGLQVRNTFLHFDEDPQQSDARSIQSMPHDMFRRCLEEEARAAAAASMPMPPAMESKAAPLPTAAPVVPAAAASPVLSVPPPRCTPGGRLLLPGTRVVIHGLTKLPAFNGQSGVVEMLDEASGRYSVLLTCPPPGVPKHAKVKCDNLRPESIMSSTPPPLSATALDTPCAHGALDFANMPATPDYFGCSPLRLHGMM